MNWDVQAAIGAMPVVKKGHVAAQSDCIVHKTRPNAHMLGVKRVEANRL